MCIKKLKIQGLFSNLTVISQLIIFWLCLSFGANVFADDHGNTIGTATGAQPNSSTPGQIETAGDNDYFRITIPSSGTLTVSTTGITDTYGYLLSSSGQPLAEDDDTPSNQRNFSITRSVNAGIYYVKVRHYYPDRTGSYTLVSSFSGTSTPSTPPPTTSTDDHGSSPTGATPIEPNSRTPGNIETAGDNDYFRITIPSSGTLTVYTTGTTDTYGYLLNNGAQELASNDDDGDGANFSVTRTVTAGTYYIKVRNYYSDRTGSYTLVSSFSGTSTPSTPPPTTSTDDHGSSPTGATPIEPNSRTPGNIETAGDNDYFRITIPSSGTLTVYTTGTTDTYGYLLNNGAQELASNDDDGDAENFTITRVVTAGTYYVRAKAYSTGIGAYTLVSSFSTASNTVQSTKAVLLLHGLNSDPSTWNELIANRYNGQCNTVQGGVVLENYIASATGEACFAIRFGSQDWSSLENGLEGVTCDNMSTGCKGDYTRIFNNGENDLGVEVRQAISRIRALKGFGVKIVLLGHSRGGLAARAALQATESNTDLEMVTGLVTTGTPHRGSPFGKIYRYLANNCLSNGVKVNSSACNDDWEAVEQISDNLNVRIPAINFLSPLSDDIQTLANTRGRLIARGLEIRMLVYTGKYLGHLTNDVLANGSGIDYVAWGRLGGDAGNQFSEQSKRFILCGNLTTCAKTEDDQEFSGDGIVPSSSQAPDNIGGQVTTNNSGTIFHIGEPKRVDDLNAALNGLSWQ
jgi:pimeloyl-ACP methyl ester carboxylesterase